MAQQKILKPRRYNSLRHPEFDYSDSGAYFVTTCTRNHESLFGVIKNGQMYCNELGLIVWDIWKSLPIRYQRVTLDAAIVMPDHFHGIVLIHDPIIPKIRPVGEVHEPPLRNMLNQQLHQRKMLLPLIMGYFKMNTAKKINLLRGKPGTPVWQRNYYDRALRDDKDCDDLIEYILTNPLRWGFDKD